MNVPGSWRCEPKEAQKIKPVFQRESMEFFFQILESYNRAKRSNLYRFFSSLCRSCSRFGTIVLGSWDMGIYQIG